MSAADDSGDSVVEITDEEDNGGPSSPSVVGSEEELSSSCDELDFERSLDFLDEAGSRSLYDTNPQVIHGKCVLCENLDSEIDLDYRCQIPSAEPW